MLVIKRGNGRLLAIVAISAMVLSQSGGLWAGSTGRQFSGCIKTCNDTRKACSGRCSDDCSELFPGGGAAFNACKAECKTTCNGESDDCKLICQNIKNPPSPEEP